MTDKNKILLFVSSAALLVSISLLHFLSLIAIISYTILFIISSVIYLFISWYIFKNEIRTKDVYLLIFFALLLRLSFISTTPIGSDDVYRYMWDGKIQSNGINPYLYKPIDEHLNSFHSDLLPAALNFKEMKTIYFPLSQWLFYTGYKLSGESVWGYKFLLFLFEMLTLAAIFLLTKKMKIDLKYSLLYALCPLSIFQFGIDAHLDGFGLPLLLFSFYLYFDNKKILSAIFLGLSLSIKPVGLVIIPIFFLNEKNILDKIKIAVIPFIAFFVQFIPYIATTNPFEAFFIFTKNWYFNGFVFNIFNTIFSNNQTSRLICGILLVISLVPLYYSKKALIEKIYFALMLLMIFSPVVHPWYIAWIAILLPIAKMKSGVYFIAASSLTAFTILNYQLYEIWKDYWLVMIIEYVPLLFLFFSEMTKDFSLKKILPSSKI